MMGLGVTDLLTSSIYGDVDKTEIIFGKFYSARQHSVEDVSSCGCRLEDLHSLAILTAC